MKNIKTLKLFTALTCVVALTSTALAYDEFSPNESTRLDDEFTQSQRAQSEIDDAIADIESNYPSPKSTRKTRRLRKKRNQDRNYLSDENTNSSASWSLSPVFGTTVSTLNGASGAYSVTDKDGFTGGLSLILGRDTVQFETGLHYSQRGGIYNYSLSNIRWAYEFDNKYIEVPALVRIKYAMLPSLEIFLKGGVVLGLLQDSKITLGNVQNYYSSSVTPNDGKDYFNSFDVRWAVGAGSAFKISQSFALTLQADYQESLSNTSQTQPSPWGGNSHMDLTNSTFTVTAGVIWEI